MLRQKGFGRMLFSGQRPIRMDQNLRVSVLPLVKFLVRHRRILNSYLVRDDEGWLRLPSNNEIPQIPVVGFDITLTGCQTQTLIFSACYIMLWGQTNLFEQLPKWHENLTFAGKLVRRAGI